MPKTNVQCIFMNWVLRIPPRWWCPLSSVLPGFGRPVADLALPDTTSAGFVRLSTAANALQSNAGKHSVQYSCGYNTGTYLVLCRSATITGMLTALRLLSHALFELPLLSAVGFHVLII